MPCPCLRAARPHAFLGIVLVGLRARALLERKRVRHLYSAARPDRHAGCDFDAAITGIGDQFLIGMGKPKEAEAKENDDGRYCDNAESDEVEHRADIGFRCRGALIWGIRERTRCFGRL